MTTTFWLKVSQGFNLVCNLFFVLRFFFLWALRSMMLHSAPASIDGGSSDQADHSGSRRGVPVHGKSRPKLSNWSIWTKYAAILAYS